MVKREDSSEKQSFCFKFLHITCKNSKSYIKVFAKSPEAKQQI